MTRRKTIYRTAILTPQADKSISETCFVKIIDINEGGKANRASDEFEELYKKFANKLLYPTSTFKVNKKFGLNGLMHRKQSFKNFKNQLRLLGKPEFKLTTLPYKDANGKPMTSFEVSINIKETITSEYQPLETALKEYGITTPFNADGTIQLSKEEIEKVLDPLIKSQFSETFERENDITAIIKIKNRIDFEINNYLKINGQNIKASIDNESNFLIFIAII